MSNDQSYLDNGQLRDVRAVVFDQHGNMSDQKVIVGKAATYAEALKMAQDSGYVIAPENDGYDIGHIDNPDGLDAYGIPVIVKTPVFVQVVNNKGLEEIREFLAANHKDRGFEWSHEMLCAWARDAEFQLGEGNPPCIEIKSWESAFGRTQEYTISDEGIDTLEFDD